MHWMPRELGFDPHKAKERHIRPAPITYRFPIRYLVSDFTTKTMFIFLSPIMLQALFIPPHPP